eukprot:CAMPEP_0115606908 /NCGR_PEP_ID=MMETSP0272-20121206/18234_1 /TAXON_ID=71861 /ORGANISM="Scrippsiella trochoidea, Strain CCMP3099" /LENGTH=110 /DNA_ID=CAMNT_0003042573 /DNA_START=103 /DNA_END=435 /DNA_ORIENTATION=-
MKNQMGNHASQLWRREIQNGLNAAHICTSDFPIARKPRDAPPTTRAITSDTQKHEPLMQASSHAHPLQQMLSEPWVNTFATDNWYSKSSSNMTGKVTNTKIKPADTLCKV